MLDASQFRAHREAFMEAMGPNAVAVIGSPPETLRNGDSHYAYRTSSDVYYLSGLGEPQTTVVLRTGAEVAFTLFVRPRDPEREIWDGRRAGIEGAKSTYEADEAYPASELTEQLVKLIANTDTLYYAFGELPEYDAEMIKALHTLRRSERRGLRPPLKIVDPRFSLHELRLIKSPAEIEVMRKACGITCDGHIQAMAVARPDMFEHEVEAHINYVFRKNGGVGPGYSSIVGSGANGTILHYIENNARMRDGELLLIDAGCEFGLYTGDVTRTFPVNGRFSDVQKRCYEIVLNAELKAIEMTRPGVTIDEIHDQCIAILTEGMVELGLLEGPAQARIEDGSYKQFYMHRTSHWLGLDVHDAGIYSRDGKARPLEPGMIITIEPGLYIAQDAKVPAELQGIGIRIEDDILVTSDGCEILTAACPKTVSEVEAACAASRDALR